jgi:HD superfamily phosphohydrolase
MRAALNNTNGEKKDDCVLFYPDIRKFGESKFKYCTMLICDKNILKQKEIEYIKKYKSSDPEIGYNYFVGNLKPTDEKLKKAYETNKEISNNARAQNGQLKKLEESKNLPANINAKFSNGIHVGYHVYLKKNKILHTKSFMTKTLTMEQKLEKAIEWLASKNG